MESGESLKTAIVMGKMGLGREAAEAKLGAAGGKLSTVLREQ
jgi:N-acetylmuramic acid 6-phosphate (MurNAc-6-P) etherase